MPKLCYIVSFDASPLTRPKLIERLKAYGSFCPITEHTWAVLTDQSAPQVRDYLMEALSSADRLFVVRSGTEAGWRNSFGEKHDEWLKKYL